MAYGNLKADNLIYDDNGTDTVVPLAHVAGKASVDSQTFTGNVVLPTTTTGVTQAAGDDSTKLATTAYVDQSNFASTTGDTFTGDVKLGDDDYIKLGDSDELSLVHNNSGNSLFVSTTSLTTRGTELYFQEEGDSNKEWIHCLPGGSVELSYDGDKAFETDAQGISVYSNYSTIPGLAGRINFGTTNNCSIEIYDNNAANSATNNHTFKIYSQHGTSDHSAPSILYEGFFDQVWRTAGSAIGPTAELGRVNYDGGWELYYHDIQGSQGDSWTGTTCTKKLETTATGVTVTGTVTDSKGDVRKIPQNLMGDVDYTLLDTDSGKHVVLQPSVDNAKTLTVNASVFSAGDAVTILNHSAKILDIAVGAGMNLYNPSDGSTPTALAGRGMATLLFFDASNCYISGAGLS
jgi:hypothetical protein